MGEEVNKVSFVASHISASESIFPVAPLIAVPKDPKHVYPVSSFPALSTFDIAVQHAALIVPVRRTAELRKRLKHVLLRRPKMTNVHPLLDTDPIPTQSTTTTTTNGESTSESSNTATSSKSPPRSQYRKLVLANRQDQQKIGDNDGVYNDPDIQTLLESGECCKGSHTITVGYADWTVDEVLRKILPVDDKKEIPSAFEIIGPLAHINLRDELLPYKYLIGKVLLDKNAPRMKTVVNKIGAIETEYRTFGMEVIAGIETEGWSYVTLKENGYQYELDFREVYWNSRLGGEHSRLVELIRRDAAATTSTTIVVADLMAGIGPFAVPLTSTGTGTTTSSSSRSNNNSRHPLPAGMIQVHANDLNPASFKYLQRNAEKNKCENLTCYNMDARAFCHSLQDQGIDFHHVLMNLPASAPEFLNAFRGFTGQTLPRIHVHCFGAKVPLHDAEQECIHRCSTALGCVLKEKEHNVTIHTVRDVSPKKNMYCVSFTLPKEARELTRIILTTPPPPTTTTETKQSPSNMDDEPEEEEGQELPVAKRTKF